MAVRYSVFALAAITINLATQWLGLHLYRGPLALPVAMAGGTAAGLATKYVLDKRWIFYDPEIGLRTHMRKFLLYSVMGVATTILFWGTELAFDAISVDGRLRFVGGAIGLVAGYALKYRLDNWFVFEAPS